MIIAAIIFLVFGILIKYGKMYFLIAGYNTMPEEEKQKYDIEGIASVFGNVLFGMALVIFAGVFISKWIDNPEIQYYAFGIAMCIGLPYLLIQSNSKKYKR